MLGRKHSGLTGTVLSIQPCPQPPPGPGRLVLTTVNHLNRDVIELDLRGTDGHVETLRPTGNHKFYSVTRNEWLSAGELREGEQLDGVDGLVTVAEKRTLPGTHRVYNLTVQGEHLYRVANSGVLVHNTCNINAVLNETASGTGNFTSAFRLSEEEALDAAIKWLGPGYREVGRPGSGVFVSADGLRRFRMDAGSLLGKHRPNVPHVHFEWLDESGKVMGNNHVPISP